jgi:FixJ family two-component response regulator
MSASSTPTIFLVDDDPAVRKALSRVLLAENWNVQSLDSAEAFLAHGARAGPGCLVLDVTMPGIDGLALQRRLSEERHALPIVFLTGHGDIPMSVAAMKGGAVDFLTKPVNADALVRAVRAALDQDASTRHSRAESADLEERLASLTPREREVLVAIVKGKLNKQIAGDLGIVEQTVKFHRAKIMERMRVRTVAELMHVAARLGVGPDASDAPRPGAAPGH